MKNGNAGSVGRRKGGMRVTAWACLAMAAIRLVSPANALAEEPIRHKFLLADESRKQLLYVDETDASKSWAMAFQGGRDIQLVGASTLLMSNGSGYSLVALATRSCAKELKASQFSGTTSVRRRADGTTLIGANQKGIAVFELDREDKIARTMRFPEITNLRLMRQTPEGAVLLAEEKGMTEVAFDGASPGGGRIVRRIPLPRGRNAYMALKTAAGHYLVAGGYARGLFEQKPDGTLVRTYEADMPAGMANHFYAGFQVLKNGHLVVSHWTGHGAKDSAKAWQLLEFEPGGKLVWKWHDPDRAGSAHGVLVLDEIDPQAFNDDTGGVLGPASR
jgi:hypothetical protein